MRYVKSVAVWGDADLPEGYISMAMIILDPETDLYFTVGVPMTWLEKASEKDKARAVGETVLRELLSAARNVK